MAAVVPPAQVINATNKAGLIVVITTYCLVSIWVALVTRAYVRLKINGPWKWDDWCVAAATSLSCVRSAIVFVEVNQGYGKSGDLLSGNAILQIGKNVFADNILYILALFISKCAVLVLCGRIAPSEIHSLILWSTKGLCALWALVSILLISINCNSTHAWVDITAQCPNITSRWIAICVLDIVTELILFAIPIYLVVGLKMSLRLKSIVIIAFGIRLPVIIFSILRLLAVNYEITSPDPTLNGSYTSAFTQIELDYSIIACTMSCLYAFLKPFTKEMGPSRDDSYTQRSYQLSSLSSANNHIPRSKAIRLSSTENVVENVGDPVLRKDGIEHRVRVESEGITMGGGGEGGSMESSDSKRGIIMKQVQWEVAREGSLGSRPVSWRAEM